MDVLDPIPAYTSGRRFFRSVASVALGNYGAIALSVLQSVVLARRLGAAGFGRLALVMMAVQVLSTITFSWSQTGLIRFGAQEFARTGSIAETFWARTGLVVPWLLALVAALLAQQHRAAAYLEIPVWAVWLIFAYFVVSQLLVTLGLVFQALEQMNRYAATLYLDKAVVLFMILLLPATYASSPVSILACYAAGSLLVFGWALAVVDRQALAPTWPTREALADLWRFSIPVLLSSGIGLAGGQAAIFAIVNHFHSIAALGVYSLASQIAGVLQQMAIIISLVLLPRLSVMVSRKEDDRVRRLIQHVVPYGLLAVSLLLSACALIARIGIPLVFGPVFGAAVPLLMVLIVNSMALTFFALFVPFFNAYGLTWTLTGISAASAVVNLMVAFLLVPNQGSQGAAIATVAASSMLALLTLVAVGRRFRLNALRFAFLSLPVVLTAVSSLLLDGGPVYLVGLGAMIVSTYALVSALGLFGREDLAALGRVGMPVSVGQSLAKLFPYQASESR